MDDIELLRHELRRAHSALIEACLAFAPALSDDEREEHRMKFNHAAMPLIAEIHAAWEAGLE